MEHHFRTPSRKLGFQNHPAGTSSSQWTQQFSLHSNQASNFSRPVLDSPYSSSLNLGFQSRMMFAPSMGLMPFQNILNQSNSILSPGQLGTESSNLKADDEFMKECYASALANSSASGSYCWDKCTDIEEAAAKTWFKTTVPIPKEPEIYSESNEERTCLDMTILIDGKLEDPLIKDKNVSLLGRVICGQKISMGSDIGPPPSPHSLIDQDFSPITTHSQDWMDVNNGFFEVRQYAKPCAFCTRNHLVCCEATRPGSKKCEACRVVKGVCVFDETPVFSEGRKVWCNPTTKSYGFEHPIQEVPTDDFDSGVRSVLKKAGVPTGGIPISSRGWVNHEGVERDQVGSSERSARSNLRRAKEAKANQPAKRQRRNPSKPVTKTRPNLDAVANGSSSEEDGDDEGNDDDEGIDKRGNTAETEDGEYRPPLDDAAPPSPPPTRRRPNPSRGESSIPTKGKTPVNRSPSLLRAPPTQTLRSTLPRVAVQRSPTANPRASTSRSVDPVNRGVTPGVDDLVPWIPEGSELESDGFTRDRRTAMGLLVETHYLLGQGIQELIRGNPGRRFMGLAAVSDQMELAMTRVIREMGGWFEHLESNGFVPYEAWDGVGGEGPTEDGPAE
ncbi:hypothetical protein PPACK8108_LOCUS25503 [Phakopsora pachyrhizi]|uniref:Zn(2)-C6 fungal-type domain-containing protein n=1 Tax=Phakopsora pachyrhizi TaxID=170000 RepID=A0AAV0BUV5_PHAPC|nr:hypothetical protein PPACK8108_LOCUS25503 [Phakopsora pachyrhizi]